MTSWKIKMEVIQQQMVEAKNKVSANALKGVKGLFEDLGSLLG